MTNLDIMIHNQIMGMYSENENEYITNIENELYEEEKEQA